MSKDTRRGTGSAYHDCTERNCSDAAQADGATARFYQGLVHLYCGEGKGKTTAAMGMAIRALGRGKRVAVIQFSKDGTSGEVEQLRKLGAVVRAGNPDGRFLRELSGDERAALRQRQTALLEDARSLDVDMLVLDEACFAAREDVVDEELLRDTVCERPAYREVVITGRNPLPWMLDAADYITEMRCIRHPYGRGIAAREGVEY